MAQELISTQDSSLTVEELRKREADLLVLAQKNDHSQKEIVIKLAKTMSERFKLEARSETELKFLNSTICSTITDLYKENHISYHSAVSWALKKYPGFKRVYEQDEGSLLEKVAIVNRNDLIDLYVKAKKEEEEARNNYNEKDRIIQRIEKRAAKENIPLPVVETKRKGNRISVLYKDPVDTDLIDTLDLVKECIGIMQFEIARNPPEAYVNEGLKKGFIEFAKFFHPLFDHKNGTDPLSWLRIYRVLKEEGTAPAADDDPIVVNVCASCSSNVIKNPDDYVLMNFHEEVEIRSQSGSLIEVLENVWQCPECKGFERMKTGISTEHIANREVFLSHLIQDFFATFPYFMVLIRAWKHSVRSQIGLRVLRTVSIFENA